MFFHIRLLDDLKDYKKDVKNQKNRYLLNIKKMKKLLIIVIVAEVLLILFFSIKTALIYLFLLFFSFGIYYDFFISFILSKNTLLNNSIHQIFIVLLGVFIFLIYHSDFSKIDMDYLFFVLNMYFVFAFFEISRKIKKEKNKEFNDSYANILGKLNFNVLSAILIFVIALLTIKSLFVLNSNLFFYLIIIIVTSASFICLILSNINIVNYRILKISFFTFLLVILVMLIIASTSDKSIIFETEKLVISL